MKLSLLHKMLLPMALSGVAIVVCASIISKDLQRRNTEQMGVIAGSALANQVKALRSFYTESVVKRALAGGLKTHHDLINNESALPLPATFVKNLGYEIAASNPGTHLRLYSKFPFPHRIGTEDARLDAFEERAYATLVNKHEEPVYEIGDYRGRLSVRYAVADVMTKACVDCHNTYPETPKNDWRVGDVRGVIEVVMPLDEADSGVLRGALLITLVFLIAAVAVWFFGRLTLAPLVRLRTVFSAVGQGDLTVEASASNRDEIGELANDTNRMVRQLRTLMRAVRDATGRLANSAAHILSASQEQEHGAVEQASTFEEITRTAGGNADAARAISAGADEMRQAAEDLLVAAELGRSQVEITLVSMGDIVKNNNQLTERVNELYEHSQGIIRVVDIIDNISDRLDLRALNAALEGSRAGEVGKGFSLVAQEMRRLAENVTESTKEIKDTVKEIHGFTQATREASDAGNATTQVGVDAVQKLTDFVDEIARHAQQTADTTRRITASTQQQLTSNEQVVSALDELTDVSRQSQHASSEVTTAVMEINSLAEELRKVVGRFRVENDPVEQDPHD
ncbi:MAG: methyl-accepting chemotaxis protein [Myxococcota bacterium]